MCTCVHTYVHVCMYVWVLHEGSCLPLSQQGAALITRRSKNSLEASLIEAAVVSMTMNGAVVSMTATPGSPNPSTQLRILGLGLPFHLLPPWFTFAFIFIFLCIYF